MVLMDWFANAGHGGLTFRPLADPTPELEFVVVYRSDEPCKLVHEFVKVLKRLVSEG